IRLLHVYGQRVDFAERQVREVIAGPSAIVGNAHAAVRAGHHSIRILTVNPEGAKVAKGPAKDPVLLWTGKSRPRFAPVFGAGDRGAGNENPVGVVGINPELVEGIAGFSSHVVARRIRFAPGQAAVIGAIDLAAD